MKNYNNLILDIENDFYLIKINRPKFLNALNQEQPDYVEASKEMLDSKWAKQKPNRANRMSERMAEIATKIFN